MKLYSKKLEELKTQIPRKLNQKANGDPEERFDVFISYCWWNSKRANPDKPDGPGIGFGDPRELKDKLTEAGLKCWLDVEHVGSVCFLLELIAQSNFTVRFSNIVSEIETRS